MESCLLRFYCAFVFYYMFHYGIQCFSVDISSRVLVGYEVDISLCLRVSDVSSEWSTSYSSCVVMKLPFILDWWLFCSVFSMLLVSLVSQFVFCTKNK